MTEQQFTLDEDTADMTDIYLSWPILYTSSLQKEGQHAGPAIIHWNGFHFSQPVLWHSHVTYTFNFSPFLQQNLSKKLSIKTPPPPHIMKTNLMMLSPVLQLDSVKAPQWCGGPMNPHSLHIARNGSAPPWGGRGEAAPSAMLPAGLSPVERGPWQGKPFIWIHSNVIIIIIAAASLTNLFSHWEYEVVS